MNKVFLVCIALLFFNSECLSQLGNKFENKVFTEGSERFFGRVNPCEFFFECDCCHNKILFLENNFFIQISPCVSNMEIFKGSYVIEKNFLTLENDGTKIFKKWNFESETDPNQEKFTLETSQFEVTQKKYKIDLCRKPLLIDDKNPSNLAAVSSKHNVNDELHYLELDGILKLLK